MSLAERAVWCVHCGAPPDVAISVERNGVIAHYGSCWAHIEVVARRMRTEVPQPERDPLFDSPSDELDARRRILLSIDDEHDRAAVLAVFHRVDWRRHQEVTGGDG